MSDMRFDDDVVIITGAGRGLGREHALAFAARGAAVVVNDPGRDDAGTGFVAHDVAQEISTRGGRAIADTHPVGTAASARAIVEAAITAFGKVTVLVNNAGVIDYATLEQIQDDAWRRMIEVTLDGTFHMTRAIWPHFAAQGHGRIVNTTSNVGFAGNEQLVHYGAAKLGIAGFTRALAQETPGTGITVNAIAPMAVTRMNRDAFFAGIDPSEDWQADIRNGVAPIGPAAAVSPTVLWLAHQSTTVNGEIYSTSSGKVARVAFIVGEGYFKPGHRPEDLRDNADAVRAIGSFLEPANSLAELAAIPKLFGAS